jgi:hypothetical protein
MPDPIADLRAHVDAAHAAAEKLVQEANARAAEAEAASREQTRDVPPHGWDVPPAADDPSAITPDLAAIMALMDSVRGVIPDDISQQLVQALRDLLLALRALIDWYVERLESLGTPREAAQKPVEDVPIL